MENSSDCMATQALAYGLFTSVDNKNKSGRSQGLAKHDRHQARDAWQIPVKYLQIGL